MQGGAKSKGPLPEGLTALLEGWSGGDRGAREQLFSLVYRELRRRAASQLRRERRDHTLRPTELVHEAYIRLSQQHPRWQSRIQFYTVASQIMRRILVDHARARLSRKRPDPAVRVSLDEDLVDPNVPDFDVVALDDALEDLSRMDLRQGRIVELRFFGGLTSEEIAEALGVSVATVQREWRLARAWLYGRVHERTP
jgi:RNA polymerase sigma factor (TIGR02999 family)